MIWKMSGWIEKAETGQTAHNQYLETYVNADSMDDAFEKARAIYGTGIDTAQPERKEK